MRNVKKLRALSQIFSPSVFEKIVRRDDLVLFQKHVSKHLPTASHKSNLDVINTLYRNLQQEYRCEYVYKNNLINHIIKNHSLKSTSIINEFKIGGSKADLVMLNGTVRVFEIKTELDGLEKLSKQLDDYQKFAEEVNVVTDEKYARKLLKEYDKSSIGIIALNGNNELVRVKEAQVNDEFLHFDTIFKVLRKQEYLDLVTVNFGQTPSVPNTKIYRACFELLASVDIRKFQKQVMNKLKERKLRSPTLLQSAKTPKALKHICNTLDFTDNEYQKMYNFLSSKRVCINPI